MDLQESQLLGRYQIINLISKGGMASVYRALDTVLDREVALKILHSHLENKEGLLERSLQEAKLIAQLQHPNIVSVYDFFEYKNRAVVIMDLIDGSTLASLVQLSFPVPENIVLMIAAEILKALRAAHGKGIIHRDIKPANILVSKTKGIKLSDFGLAKLQNSHSNLTQEGTFVGTPSFASPEQIQGLPLDMRSDIFSLGLTLFILAKKAHAFRKKGDSEDTTVRKIVQGEKNDQVILSGQTLSPDFEEIIQKAIQLDPEKRFQTSDEMLKAVQDLLRKRGLAHYESNLQSFLADPTDEEKASNLSKTQVLSIKDKLQIRGSSFVRFNLAKLFALIAIGAAVAIAARQLYESSFETKIQFKEPEVGIRLSDQFKVYESNSGVQLIMALLKPEVQNRWLSLVNGVDGIFNNQALILEYSFERDRPSFFIQDWGGIDYYVFTIFDRGGKSIPTLVLPFSSLSDSSLELEAIAADKAKMTAGALVKKYYERRLPGAESFDRQEYIQRDQKALEESLLDTNQVCEANYSMSVAWADVRDEDLYFFDIARLCSRPLQMMQSLCLDSDFTIRRFFDSKDYVCSFGTPAKVDEINGKILWQVDFESPPTIVDFYRYMKKRYSD